MGVVYRATDERLRRTVALKVLPEALARDDERRRRPLREARAAAAVTHPNIATVHDVGEADGRVFIAMEYVEGPTLRARLADGALAAPAALRIALQIARGLAKAHQANVVHRDLKPDNVIVGENHVKILDFGLAKLRDEDAATPSALEHQETETELTRQGKVLGTPAYMSPEQARGKDVDARTDVFGFGVVPSTRRAARQELRWFYTRMRGRVTAQAASVEGAHDATRTTTRITRPSRRHGASVPRG